MVKLHWGKDVVFAGTARKPESTPAAGVVMFWHGAANVDCVTVWFFDWLYGGHILVEGCFNRWPCTHNWKATMSLTDALILKIII